MRPSLESTQLLPRPIWQNPRIHLLDDTWLLTIGAMLVATGLPWFTGNFDVEIGTATLGLVAIGGLHIGFTMLASAAPTPSLGRSLALRSMHSIGVMLIGFVWAHVGGLQNPLFLLTFALPVIGSIFVSRWHPYWTALLSVLVVGFVALAQAPDLRWYVSGFLGHYGPAAVWFDGASNAAPPLFAGFYAPTSYLTVLLEVFAVLITACAMTSEYLGTIFERLINHSTIARAEAEQGQELWIRLIEQFPIPALLVDPSSLQVVACSNSALLYLGCGVTSFADRTLFEVVQFSYPDLIQDRIVVGDAAPEALITLRVEGSLRLARAYVRPVRRHKRQFALLTLTDATEAFCLRGALESSEYAALVIDSQARILAFNRMSSQLFGEIEVGSSAAGLVRTSDPSGAPWWDPGINERRKTHIEIGGRIYELTTSRLNLPGEEESLHCVSLLPVARVEAASWTSPQDPASPRRASSGPG